MKLGLVDKKILITGASRGIGLAIANGFASEGADLWLLARSEDRLKAVQQDLRSQFGQNKVMSSPCDCSDLSQLNEVKGRIQEQWGKLDTIVSNVGDGRSVADALPAEDIWQRTWQNNFETALNTSQAFLPIIQSDNGSLLFISSIAGIEAFGAPTDYSTAKSAIHALSKNLARKLAPKIRVNVIAPGNVLFPGGVWEQKRKKDKQRVDEMLKAQVPMQRFATPEEIADSVIFLSSDRAKFITGATFTIDGGQTTGIWH